MKTAIRLLLPGIMLLLVASCAPQHPRDIALIDSLRVSAEELIKHQSVMGWNNWTHGAASNQDSLYRAYAHLFTKENIALVERAEANEPDSVQQKRLRFFRHYLTTELISKELAPLTDSVSNLEATLTVTFQGKSIPYRQVSSLLSNETSQPRRAALYAATDSALDALNAVLVQVEEENQNLAKELGFASYNTMVEAIKDIDLHSFARTAETILDDTDSLYTGLLQEILKRELRLPADRFFRYDTGQLFRVRRFDTYFPQSPMMDLLRTTYEGLGIDLDAQRNLTIDAATRDTKNPRAVCFAVDIPNDVRLSIKPIGGYDDYAALFHEVGHGLHFANTTENAFEFKYLGENTVTETFAFLSEHLLANQAWLRQHGSMPAPVLKDFVRLQAFKRLYFIRRYCAKFLYEMDLHSGAPNPHVTYSQLLSRAIGSTPLASDEKRYLTDLDQLYYSATYLRAWFLEAQLNARLTRDFGANWFEHPAAGAYLRSLWARGARFNGDELVRELGYDRISPDMLLNGIKQMILFSAK